MPHPKILTNNAKHLTNNEIRGRRKAHDELTRDEFDGAMKMPATLRGDDEAYKCWRDICRRAKGLCLYDKLDTDTLALYCKMHSRLLFLRKLYDDASRTAEVELDDVIAVTKELRATEALLLQYANRLGLTPESRARLVTKRAKAIEAEEGDDIYGVADHNVS